MRKQPNIDHFLLKKTCFPCPKAGNPIPGFELKAFGIYNRYEDCQFLATNRHVPPSSKSSIITTERDFGKL